MMQRFFVFLQTDLGKTYEVATALAKAKLKYVCDISSISGKWDILIRVEIDNRLDVGREVVGPIIGMGHVKKTKTVVAYYVYDPNYAYFNDD